MKIKPYKTKLFHEGDDLVSFVISAIKKVPEASVIVIASKIVALAEGCTVYPYTKETFEKLVERESTWAIRTQKTWLTESRGMIMASAGVDESNGNGKLVFLPKDPYKSAEILRRALMKIYKVKKLGIVISDSGLLPLRRGVIAQAIGYDGFVGVRDYVGKKDLFGRKLVMSSTNIADSLATAGSLSMGEGDERQPLALITDAPIVFTNSPQRGILSIEAKDDMFYPLFQSLKHNAKKKK
jgi:F420-0:gamma-glutamyl ligase